MNNESRYKMPEPHPAMPNWARPMWDLLALVHQGNIDAMREAETVRHRVWLVEGEQRAINEQMRELRKRVIILERSGRDTMPAPSADDEETSPSLRVSDHDGDPGPG